jgi:hypothetical protein
VNFLLRLASNHHPPDLCLLLISASQVARVTGISYHIQPRRKTFQVYTQFLVIPKILPFSKSSLDHWKKF